MAHHGLYCFTCLRLHTPQLVAASALLCPFLSFLSVHMVEPQCIRLPLGITEWNHSYYTRNPLSALHSLQQLQAGASSPSPVQMSASTRESHGAATSSSVSRPQVKRSVSSPQVQTGPTRTVTSDLVSATLAEAATQLSFAAFLERCIPVSASPLPPLPISTHLWMPLRKLFHTSLSPRTFLHNSRLRSSLSDLPTHNPSRASLHLPRVKSIPLNTENWLRKLYDKNYNNDTSNEDKHETNYSMNNDTRKMHIT